MDTIYDSGNGSIPDIGEDRLMILTGEIGLIFLRQQAAEQISEAQMYEPEWSRLNDV